MKVKKKKIGRPPISDKECLRVSFIIPVSIFKELQTIGKLSGKGYGYYMRKACEQFLKEDK